MGQTLSQMIWIPNPIITEKNVPDQTGRVYIITGGYSGCGLALASNLYSANARVYIAGRNASTAKEAITSIEITHPGSKGELHILELDLSDLVTIKAAATLFLSRETRLDVLNNNAGVMMTPLNSQTAQGYDLQVGTNCLGPFLLTKLLLPILQNTARSSPAGSVRVLWAGSLAIDLGSPKPGGMTLDSLTGEPKTYEDLTVQYSQSKVGNLYLASECARRFREGEGRLISLCFNPGNLISGLNKHVPYWKKKLFDAMCYETKYGGYTELFCAVSGELENGAYIHPWGRVGGFRDDIGVALRDGRAEKFWEWCEEQVKQYV